MMQGRPIPGGGKGGKKKLARMEDKISKKPPRVGGPGFIKTPTDPTKPRPGQAKRQPKPPKRTATSRPRPGVGPKPITRPVKRGR
jgi:hypothetical protein